MYKIAIIITLVIYISGCAINVPTGKVLIPLTDCQGSCYTNILLLVNPEKIETDTKIQPYPMSNSYIFKLDKSVVDVLTNLLMENSYNVDVNTIDDVKYKIDHKYKLKYELVDYTIKIASSGFSAHSTKVTINYILTDINGEIVFSTSETGSSLTRMSGKEWGASLFVPFEGIHQQNSFASSIGRSWDMAVMDSSAKFVKKLKLHVKHGPT